MTRILLTNDDGIEAPGLAALRDVLDPLGEVVTIAPDGNRSAVGRAITIGRTLRAREREFGGGWHGYALDGTPVDCVRAATMAALCEPPDLVVSGVNPGPNMGPDVTYSGTVAAALEAALLGLPGVAVSIMARQPEHLLDVTRLVAPIVGHVAGSALPEGSCLNVNLPDLPAAEVRGARLTSLGQAVYHESIVVEESDGHEHRYRIDGDMSVCEQGDETDFGAVACGFVSITPLRIDWHDPAAAETLAGWELEALVLAIARGEDVA